MLCAVWGLGQVAIKVGNSGVSPVLGAGIRSAGAAALVWTWSALRGVPLFRRDGTLGYGLLIGAMFGVEFLLVYWGLVFTTAARSVLFVYTAPFVVAIGAHWLLPGERLRTVKVVGLVCAFAGVATAVIDALTLPTRRELLGDMMQLGAAFLWGATSLVIKARRRPPSPHKTLFYQLAVSGAILLPLSYAVGEAGVTSVGPAVLGALFFQTVIIAGASYLAWFSLLARYPASEMHAFSFWTPLFGALGAALLLNEPVTPAMGVALALVALGTYLVSRPA